MCRVRDLVEVYNFRYARAYALADNDWEYHGRFAFAQCCGRNKTSSGCVSAQTFNRHHLIGYSSQEKDGKYPDGTKATLSCSHGHPFGRTESLCDDGEWIQKLGHCGSNCSQRALEELGYSDVHVDGKRTDGNVTHRTDVELLCGEERHEYRCFDGVFRSKHLYRPCGICSTAMAARLGYTAVNIRGKSAAGYPVEGTLVGLLCRDGCTPPNSTTAKYALPTFTTAAKNGTYESGTLVNLFCETGPVIDGPSQSRCFGGGWNPPLGRCPHGCQELDKRKSKGSLSYSTSKSNGKYPDGTTATLSCREGSVVGSSKSKCYDEKWSPMIGYCRVDLSCKFGSEERGWGFSGMFPFDVLSTPNGNDGYFKCGQGTATLTFSNTATCIKPGVINTRGLRLFCSLRLLQLERPFTRKPQVHRDPVKT
ncbi:unnamed protein product [Heligmosomoides polygyrus]|uniref:Sushi domain-containing protein n=1 Tax=Heligmosomoides polygyrus TaxID=6339 RepID=A0A183FDQ8_HELPZ|nr:unnamed protein product [Heligmosomoides polygyrus]